MLQTYTWSTGDYAYQSWSNSYKIHLTLTEESNSVENNTSVVYYKFWISNTSNNRFYSNGYSWNISIGGQSIAINNFNFYVYPYNVTQTIAEGRVTVTHLADGTLNMPYNVSIPNLKASNQYAPPAMSLSGTWELTDIPRAPTILTAPNFSDTDNPTITYTNSAGNAATHLQACICNENGTVIYAKYRDIPKTGSSYTFYLTEDERTALRNATGSDPLKLKFVIWSVIGGVTDYAQLYRTMTINDANPIVTASVVDINAVTVALTGDNKKIVRYYSNASATMSATPQKGAAIDNDLYVIRNGSLVGYGTSYTFNNVESNVFSFSATDSRGNVGTASVTPAMVNYVRLTCNMENTRPDASGNMDVRCIGNFFNGSFGAVENTITVQYRYKIIGGTYSGWNTMTVVKNGNTYGAYASFTIPNFDYHASYAFECQAVDKLDTVSSSESSLKSMPVFHWGENDFVFEVPVDVKGDLRLKGDDNYGNTLRFGDGDHCYVSEPVDDHMKVHARVEIDLEALTVKVNGDTLMDFVIATGTEAMGTNGTWYWTKWKSGKAECYGTRNFGKASVTSAWGSLYESTEYTQTFPSGLFIAKPDTLQITVDNCSGDGVMLERSGTIPSSTSTGGFHLVRPTSTTLASSYVTFHAIGRWK